MKYMKRKTQLYNNIYNIIYSNYIAIARERERARRAVIVRPRILAVVPRLKVFYARGTRKTWTTKEREKEEKEGVNF